MAIHLSNYFFQSDLLVLKNSMEKIKKANKKDLKEIGHNFDDKMLVNNEMIEEKLAKYQEENDEFKLENTKLKENLEELKTNLEMEKIEKNQQFKELKEEMTNELDKRMAEIEVNLRRKIFKLMKLSRKSWQKWEMQCSNWKKKLIEKMKN